MSSGLAPDDPAYRGQAVYSRRLLNAYDVVVLGFNFPVLWRCPPRKILALYDENASARHLDIGVGTGYFLDKCKFPTVTPAITLMDLNANSLAKAAARISRYHPQTHEANALEGFGLPSGSFDSIGLNNLLHCLPGDITTKSVVFDGCKEVLAPGGVVFGTTVLNGGVKHTWLSRRVQARYNQSGIFDNLKDDVHGLDEALATRFATHTLFISGAAALFTARV